MVVKDVVNQMADFVAEQIDGSAIAGEHNTGPNAVVREFGTLRLLAEQLAEKWANLVDSEFRIPKKLSKSVSKLVSKGMAVIQNKQAMY